MLNANFVYLGIVINTIAVISYIIYTIQGKIKPNKVTFALLAMPALISFFAQVKQGVGIQSLLTLSAGLFPLSIFLASFINKKAYWKITKFDLTCGALSLIGLILWQITKVGNLAIIFSILADALAYIPTLVKAYKFPQSESGWTWAVASISALLTILTITNWNFANSAFPFYYLLINFIVFAIVQFKFRNLFKI